MVDVLWPKRSRGTPRSGVKDLDRALSFPEQRARIISRGRVMDWLLFILVFLAIGTVWNYRGEKSL